MAAISPTSACVPVDHAVCREWPLLWRGAHSLLPVRGILVSAGLRRVQPELQG
jgi:hypothetical protein